MSAILITGADEAYAPLVADWLQSLRDHRESQDLPVCILDLGLSDRAKAHLSALGAEFRVVDWAMDFPGRAAWAEKLPGYKAMVARSSLPELVPGHDVYLWMDADTWVQNGQAVADILAAARDGALVAAIEMDRSFELFRGKPVLWQIFHDWYKATFGPQLANAMNLRPMINVGVFALSATAPHWKFWKELHAAAMAQNREVTPENFMIEQLALNICVYQGNLPFNPMPCAYNWPVHYAPPLWDAANETYREPSMPYAPLSILHLTMEYKHGEHALRSFNDPKASVRRSLRYPQGGRYT